MIKIIRTSILCKWANLQKTYKTYKISKGSNNYGSHCIGAYTVTTQEYSFVPSLLGKHAEGEHYCTFRVRLAKSIREERSATKAPVRQCYRHSEGTGVRIPPLPRAEFGRHSEGTGVRKPPLPRAEFGRLPSERHNWLVTPRDGGGRSRHLGRLETRRSVESAWLREGVRFSGSPDPSWSRQGTGGVVSG